MYENPGRGKRRLPSNGRFRNSQKRYELLKNAPWGVRYSPPEMAGEIVTLSPRSAGLLDTHLHMICLIGRTCSTPTSFWFSPP
jgi:hypothetical protein